MHKHENKAALSELTTLPIIKWHLGHVPNTTSQGKIQLLNKTTTFLAMVSVT